MCGGRDTAQPRCSSRPGARRTPTASTSSRTKAARPRSGCTTRYADGVAADRPGRRRRDVRRAAGRLRRGLVVRRHRRRARRVGGHARRQTAPPGRWWTDSRPAGAQGSRCAPGVAAIGIADDSGYRVVVGGRRWTAARAPRVGGPGRRRPGVGDDARAVCPPTAGCCASATASAATSCTPACASTTSRTGRALADLLDPGLTLKVASWSPVPGTSGSRWCTSATASNARRCGTSTTGVRRDYPLDLPGPVDVAGWWPDGVGAAARAPARGRETRCTGWTVATGAALAGARPAGLGHGRGGTPGRRGVAARGVGRRGRRGSATSTARRCSPPAAAPAGRAPARGPHVRRPRRADRAAADAGPPAPAPYPLGAAWCTAGRSGPYPDDLDPWEQALVEHGYAVAKVELPRLDRVRRWRGGPRCTGATSASPRSPTSSPASTTSSRRASPTPPGSRSRAGRGAATSPVLAAGLHPDRFAAVIGGVPVCDLVLCHEDCSPPQQAYDLAIMGGGPDELPELYAERSPITYVDAVTRAGAADRRRARQRLPDPSGTPLRGRAAARGGDGRDCTSTRPVTTPTRSTSGCCTPSSSWPSWRATSGASDRRVPTRCNRRSSRPIHRAGLLRTVGMTPVPASPHRP